MLGVKPPPSPSAPHSSRRSAPFKIALPSFGPGKAVSIGSDEEGGKTDVCAEMSESTQTSSRSLRRGAMLAEGGKGIRDELDREADACAGIV